jgi:hypothetical protein
MPRPGARVWIRKSQTTPPDPLSANEPDKAAAASVRLVFLPMVSTIAAASQC